MEQIREKINTKSARIGVIGLGYVGLPLSLEFVRAGYRVKGIDIAKEKITQLKRGTSYIIDITDREVSNAVNNGNFEVYTDYSQLSGTDCICITVPTPLNKSKEPDLSYIKTAVDGVKKHVRKGMLIVLESTTYPGATRELLAHEFEKMGFVIGKDLYIAFSPERVDPGNKKYTTKNIPKVIGGITPACGEIAQLLYEHIISEIHRVTTSEEAEMVKLLENTFRAVNIGLVNEMAIMCDRLGIDIWRVIEAAGTKPFGFMKFLPGPGLGGHCIPLDPMYLTYKARSFNFYNRFIDLATDINGNMPRFVINKLLRIVNERGISLKDAKILLMGISYKENVNDLRESPGLELIELLKEFGCCVDYHDPYVDTFEHPNGTTYNSIDLADKKLLQSYNCVMIVTAHEKIDYGYLEANSACIFDTRNVYKDTDSNTIYKL